MKQLFKTKPAVVILGIIFYIVLFGFISLWKYYNFSYNALDLAIINQVFYNSAQGNFFASSIHPPSYLGDHFTPILFLLLPIYYLFRTPQTLLILQTAVLALAAWPIYLITKKVLNSNWAMLLAGAWLINPFVQNINLFEFHFLPFAIFFIFWAFYFYQNQKFLPFIIFIILALLVREDVALVIFGFGLIALIQKRKIKWWLTPLAASIIYFLLAIKITNLFAPAQNYKFFIYYSWLGNSPVELIRNAILQPQLWISHLLKLGNLEFALGLLLPFIFISLISPFYLLLAFGVFAQLVLGASGASATLLQAHYSSLLLPPIFIASIYSIKKIISQKSNRKIIRLINQYKDLAWLILVVGLIYSFLVLGPIPGSLAKIAKNGLILAKNQSKVELLNQLPPEANIASTYGTLVQLSSRPNIYSFNYVFLGKQQFLTRPYSLPENTDYLVIDYQDLITYQLQYGNNPYYKDQYQKAIQTWPKNLNNFGLIAIADSLALYQKGVADKFSLVDQLERLPELGKIKNIVINQNLNFIGYNKLDNNYQLVWDIKSQLKENYYLELSLGQNEKIIYQKIYPLGYGLINNLDKKIIQTNYWFEFDQNIPAGVYDLTLDVITIEKGGIEIDAIRSTENVIDATNLVEHKIVSEKITI